MAHATTTATRTLWTMTHHLTQRAADTTETLSLSSRSDLALKRGWPGMTRPEYNEFIWENLSSRTTGQSRPYSPGPPPPERQPQDGLAWRLTDPNSRGAHEAHVLQSHPLCGPDWRPTPMSLLCWQHRGAQCWEPGKSQARGWLVPTHDRSWEPLAQNPRDQHPPPQLVAPVNSTMHVWVIVRQVTRHS